MKCSWIAIALLSCGNPLPASLCGQDMRKWMSLPPNRSSWVDMTCETPPQRVSTAMTSCMCVRWCSTTATPGRLSLSPTSFGLNGHDVWRKKIADATGIPAAGILLGDVHDHAAPAAGPRGETPWERRFEQALLSAVREAAKALQPVRVAAGTGTSRIGMNRRQVRPRDDEFRSPSMKMIAAVVRQR